VMNEKNIKAGYEIAIRLLVFFIVGIIVTTFFSYDPLTGVIFWSRVTNYCYALTLGMIAVLVMVASFAPKQCLEVWKELILPSYLEIKGKINSMRDIKEITFNEVPSLGLKDFVSLIQKLAAKVKIYGAGEELAMKQLQDGLETAIFCLEPRQEGDTDPKTGLPLTLGMRNGTLALYPTTRVEIPVEA